ncbi:MAG: hypothetical protein JNL96_04010 [Planctomycetaceae bacterium]|nr:hypothetical protein [Planctomycetaceae bacterium]
MTDFLNRIHQGDCVAGMNSLPEGCVDLAFADPPFNIGYKYDVYDDRREHQHYIDWSREWIAAVYRALKPNGTFWLAIGDEYAAELKLASQDIGFTCRSWVVWYYTFGVNCVNKFTRSHAHLFYFVKDPNNFTFRGEAAENRIPSARQLVYNDARANPHGRLPDDTWILRPQDMADCFTAEEDTWYFPRVAGTFKERAGFHGCQMPEQLLGRIIRCCSHEGDVVLDPFSGSATTLVTAKKLGRQFLGFELSEDYAARGGERAAAAEVGAPLVGSADPTRSAPATPGERGKRARPPVAGAPQPAQQEMPPASDADRSEGEALATAAPPQSDEGARTDVAAEVVAGEQAEPKNAALTIVEAKSADPQATLVEAFRRSCGGYSPDRLITDPKLQAAFVEHCRLLEIPGDAKAWNHALLKLRKAGKLAAVPTTQRTEMSWEDCESFLAAAEIAAAAVLSERADIGLDEVFCDPALAATFDKAATRLGGSKQLFAYRWTAMKLRKEAKQLRDRGQELRRTELAFGTPVSAARARWWKQFPTEPGLFLVLDPEGNRRYVGAALNLRARMEKLLTPTKLAQFVRSRDVRVAVLPLAVSFVDLLALAQLAAGRARSPLNWHPAAGVSDRDVAEASTAQPEKARRARRLQTA